MTKRMLIDATHSEETRVAIMDGEKLVEYEYESQSRKPIKGSIFLAKVTRVEPSLQAAFVNFGGNRHGFLPFSEIHPDYFRIPVEDRDALMAEQEEVIRRHEEALAENDEDEDGQDQATDSSDESEVHDSDEDGNQDDGHLEEEGDDIGNKIEEEGDTDDDIGNRKGSGGRGRNNSRGGKGRGKSDGRGGRGNNKGGKGRGRQFRQRRTQQIGDVHFDPEEHFRFSLRRKYKIQEVIKRGQIVLVQASKEERGNKGAAFTTYMSLPGRYCVLMPNSPRGGGVSRKIASYKDRKKMRDLLKELQVPKGMSVIVRTAGVERSKAEVKRDLDYLMRLWNNIRDLTLESSAPSLVYQEADLIKRAVRDLYARDIEEIVASGGDGYGNAKNFMKMMIPSHVKKVKEYKNDTLPLFNKYKAESQIADIGEVEVTLPSGGYLVINPTEALVSIDVNSGRSTKERHIEETALKTNLEAAAEVARQLRLRDLGGLVVIDFIDMEDRRNNSKVERKMRDALSTDRARVQNSRISSFGLMELSRQRLNPSLTESSYETCGQCLGLGRVRSADATSIMVLRAIEDEGMKKRAAQVIVHVPSAVALFMLNSKRQHLASIEERYGFQVLMRVDDSNAASAFRVEVSKPVDSDGGDEDGESDDGRKSSGKPSRSRRGGRGRRGPKRDESRDDAADQNDAQDDEKEEKPKAKRKPAPKSKDDNSQVEDNSSSEDKPKKSAPKKAAAKKSVPKKAGKSEEKEEKPAAKKKAPVKKAPTSAKASVDKKANDDEKPKKAEPNPAAEHEVVNEAPKAKKKGWWSK